MSSSASVAAVPARRRRPGRLPVPTHDEQLALAKRVAAGDLVARAEMIEANLPLVYAYARRHRNLQSEEDRSADAVIGLIRAVDRYDWTTGYKFSTYAMWWIRQAVQRGEHEGGRNVKVPHEIADIIRQAEAHRWAMAARLGYVPDDDEVLGDLFVSDRDAAKAIDARRSEPVTFEMHGADSTFLDVDPAAAAVESGAAADQHEVFDRVDTEHTVRCAVGELARLLSPEHARVVAAHYHLDGSDGGCSANATARRLGLSARKVRVLLAEAEDALRGLLADAAA